MSSPLLCRVCYSYSTPHRKASTSHPAEVADVGQQEGIKVDGRRNTQPHLLCVPYESHSDRKRARSVSHSLVQEGVHSLAPKKQTFASQTYKDSQTFTQLAKETCSLTTTNV